MKKVFRILIFLVVFRFNCGITSYLVSLKHLMLQFNFLFRRYTYPQASFKLVNFRHFSNGCRRKKLIVDYGNLIPLKPDYCYDRNVTFKILILSISECKIHVVGIFKFSTKRKLEKFEFLTSAILDAMDKQVIEPSMVNIQSTFPHPHNNNCIQ